MWANAAGQNESGMLAAADRVGGRLGRVVIDRIRSVDPHVEVAVEAERGRYSEPRSTLRDAASRWASWPASARPSPGGG
jgi:hypothetical protein